MRWAKFELVRLHQQRLGHCAVASALRRILLRFPLTLRVEANTIAGCKAVGHLKDAAPHPSGRAWSNGCLTPCNGMNHRPAMFLRARGRMVVQREMPRPFVVLLQVVCDSCGCVRDTLRTWLRRWWQLLRKRLRRRRWRHWQSLVRLGPWQRDTLWCLRCHGIELRGHAGSRAVQAGGTRRQSQGGWLLSRTD